MISKIAADSVIAVWSSTRVPRPAVVDAYTKIGKPELVPPHDKFDALTEACRTVCKVASLHVDGTSLKFEALAGGRCNLEVIRKVKGVDSNEWPFLFSAGVKQRADGTFYVDVLKSSEDAGAIHEDKHVACAALTDAFHDALDTVSAKDLTESLVRLVKGCHGIPLKSSGGGYFFPSDDAGDYVSLQSDLQKHGPNLVLIYQDLSANPNLVRHMSDSLVEEVTEGLERLKDEHSTLVSRGGKTRSNGQKRRFDQLAEFLAKIKAYRQMLSLPYKELKAAIEETRRELGLEAFRNGVE